MIGVWGDGEAIITAIIVTFQMAVDGVGQKGIRVLGYAYVGLNMGHKRGIGCRFLPNYTRYYGCCGDFSAWSCSTLLEPV